MNILCLRCYVSGRVQGVWYRGHTQRKALELGLSGYARNLADGRVEVLVCGEESAVIVLRQWLWQGSPGAQVVGVQWEPVSAEHWPAFTGFFTE